MEVIIIVAVVWSLANDAACYMESEEFLLACVV